METRRESGTGPVRLNTIAAADDVEFIVGLDSAATREDMAGTEELGRRESAPIPIGSPARVASSTQCGLCSQGVPFIQVGVSIGSSVCNNICPRAEAPDETVVTRSREPRGAGAVVPRTVGRFAHGLIVRRDIDRGFAFAVSCAVSRAIPVVVALLQVGLDR